MHARAMTDSGIGLAIQGKRSIADAGREVVCGDYDRSRNVADPVTVEFRRGNASASVNRCQTISGVARMVISTRQVMAKMLAVVVNCGASMFTSAIGNGAVNSSLRRRQRSASN